MKRRGAFVVVAMAAVVMLASPTAAGTDPEAPDPNAGYSEMANLFGSIAQGIDTLDPEIKRQFAKPALVEPGQTFTSFTGQEAVFDVSFDYRIDSAYTAILNPHEFVVSGDLNGDGSPEGGPPVILDATGAVGGGVTLDDAANVLFNTGWQRSSDGMTWTYDLDPGNVWTDGTPIYQHDALVTHAGALPETTIDGTVMSVPDSILVPEVVIDLETRNLIPPTFPGGAPSVKPGATTGDFFREILVRGGTGATLDSGGLTLLDDGTFLYQEGFVPQSPGPIVFIGAGFPSLPDLSTPGSTPEIIQIDLGDDRGDGPLWVAGSSFENDYARELSHLKSFTYIPPVGIDSLIDLSYDGSSFNPAPANSAFFAGPGGAGHVIDGAEFVGVDGFDLVIFLTDPNNPVQPTTVAKSNLRGRPSLFPPVSFDTTVPAIVLPAGPGASLPAVVVPAEEEQAPTTASPEETATVPETPATTDPGTATTATEDGPVSSAAPSEVTTTVPGSGGGGVPAWLSGLGLATGAGLVAGGSLVVFGPGLLFWRSEEDEESDDADLPGLDDFETADPALVHTVPEAPPKRLWEDTYLRHFSAEDAEWELNDADRARWMILKDADASAAWASAQTAETALQAELEALVNSTMTDLQAGITAFSSGVEAYSGGMETLIRDSEMIARLWNEWTREGGVKDMMWWADLADAVVGLAKLAIGLGVGGTKLAIRFLSASDEAADAVKASEALAEGTAAAGKVDEAVEGGAAAGRGDVRFGEANEIYDGADFAKLDEWLCGVLGRNKIDDYAEALPAAARRLGYFVDFTAAEREIILRLATQLRIAANGNKVSFRADDLAWLHRMGQNPDFWEALGRAATLDIDTRVYKLVDDLELDWLKNLARSDDAANAARNVPAGPVTLPSGGAPLTLPSGPPLPPGAATVAPPVSAPTQAFDGALTLPTPAPVATGVFPDLLTLPHINPNAGAIGGGGALTLPTPPGTAVFDGALTLPEGFQPFSKGWDAAETVIDGVRTRPPGGWAQADTVIEGFKPLTGWDSAETVLDVQKLGGQGWDAAETVLDTQRLSGAGAPAVNVVNPASAAVNPSGIGGLTINPAPGAPSGPLPSQPLSGLLDAVETGVHGGADVSAGAQLAIQLGLVGP